MRVAKMQTQHRATYFHAPNALARSAFIHVFRAGHLQAAPDHVVDRNVCIGHDLIYCVKGVGHVRTQGEEHTIVASQLLWIDGRYPHRHWPDASDPWEVLWIRADGCALTLSADALDVRHTPIFTVDTGVASFFRNALEHLKVAPSGMDALLHADASAILAAGFASRSDEPYAAEPTDVPPQLQPVMAKMGTTFHQQWTVRELAKTAHMSEHQFFRVFREATGYSPIAWIRRQRMDHARRKLLETKDSVKQIAEQVGYASPFYFSRDFRLAYGLSPKHFRMQEKSLQSVSL